MVSALLAREVWFTLALVVAGAIAAGATEAETPTDEQLPTEIAIEAPDPSVKLTFWQDIRPILERSCLACHNENSIESDVILETVETIVAYEGDEPLIVPGDAQQGKLLRIASHRQEPVMPPEENEAGATNLTPSELGRIQRWIELGAPAGEKEPATGSMPTWQPLPKNQSPVMAARLSTRGDLVAAAFGNHLELIDVHDDSAATPLVDPSLREAGEGFDGAAHLDVIRALAVSRDGNWIASGGYRTVKLWRHQRSSKTIAGRLAGHVRALAARGGWIAAGDELGNLALAPITDDAAAVEPRTWRGHEASIVALALSDDLQFLVSAASDGSLKRWQISDGKLVAAWTIAPPVRRAVFIDSQHLAAVADDLVLRCYRCDVPADTSKAAGETSVPPEPATLEATHELRGHGRRITTLASGAHAAGTAVTGSDDGFVRLWDLEAGQQERHWIHGAAIEQVVSAADGTRWISVDAAGMAKCWAADSDAPLWERPVDFRLAERVLWARQSVELATSNLEVAKQRLADAQKQLETDQQKATTAKKKNEEAVTELQEATKRLEETKQQLAAAAQAAEAVAKLQQQAGQLQEKLKTELAEAAKAGPRIDELLALAEQASTAEPTDDRATDESAPKLALATAVDNLAQSLAALGENRTQQLEDLTGKIDALAAAVTEQTATAAAEKEALEKQKEEREKAVSEAQEEKRDADDLVRRAEEGVEASTVVVAQATAAADQFEQALGARQQQLASLEQSGRRPCVAAGPTTDGKHVWFADQGGNVHVLGIDGRSTAAWNATGELDLAAACVTTDGRIAIAGETPQAALQSWAIRGQWALRQTIGGPSAADSLLQGRVLALDFSPDGRLLAIGGGIAAQEGQVVLWNLEQKQIERALDKPHDDVVLGLQFSRDGTRLATSSADRLMKVFDVEDGRMLKVFEGHAHHVLDVAWRASGLQLATGSADKTVKVWDFSTGEQIRTLPAGKEEVIGVEFLGVGSLLAVAAGDGVVRIYNADDGKQARAITSGGGYLFTSAADSAGDKILVGGARQFWQVYSSGDGAKLHGPVGE